MIPLAELVSADALRRYDDTGDPVYTTLERVVLALRWFDWATAEMLTDALDVGSYAERQRYSRALDYLVKRGRIERRGTAPVEYRLLARKRAQAACSRCSAQPVEGATMCQRHLDWERDYKRKRRAS